MTEQLSIANFVTCTEAEGPGRRFALWLQGCPLRCPGCCNPEFLSFSGGTPIKFEELQAKINIAVYQYGIEGISLLGGEPTAQAEGVAELAKWTQTQRLSVMLYSGFTLAELRTRRDPAIEVLLANTDVLVDGRYQHELSETKRRWIGSANQVVHFLTDRYRADDPCWTKRNTLELRVTPGEISVNGFPAAAARELWKGWSRS